VGILKGCVFLTISAKLDREWKKRKTALDFEKKYAILVLEVVPCKIAQGRGGSPSQGKKKSRPRRRLRKGMIARERF
jgi:hypothetical protein